MTLCEASKAYGIPKGTLSHKMHKKHMKKVGGQQIFNDFEEESFVQHMITVSEWGFPFDPFELRCLCKSYLDKLGRKVTCFPNNMPSADWARLFLKRHSARLSSRFCQNIKTSRAVISPEIVQTYFDNLKGTLQDGDSVLPPQNIFNFDETCLCDDPGIKKCVFRKGTKYAERVRDSTKSNTSIMFCASADGTVLPPYVVYKAEHLWNTWVVGGPKNCRFNRTKSGWFDAKTFQDWFFTIFIPHVNKLPGKKVVIGDNLASHFSVEVIQCAKENDVAFTCLPKNSTHLTQPLDVAFFAPMKRRWRAVLDEWKKSCQKHQQTISKMDFPRLLRKLFESFCPNQKEFLPVGNGTGWSESVVSGFRKTGICPFDPSQVLKSLPPTSTPDTNTINQTVSSSVISMLKNMRYGPNAAEKHIGKRSRMNVVPGKSISEKDLGANNAGSEEEISELQEDEPVNSCPNLDEDQAIPSTSTGTCCTNMPTPFLLPVPVPDAIPSIGFHASEANQSTNACIAVNNWVAVKFLGKCSIKHYIGQVMDMDAFELTIRFLRLRRSKFVWPDVADEVSVDKEQIVRVLSEPEKNRGFIFLANELAGIEGLS